MTAVYRQPFFDLIQQARAVYEAHWPAKDEMQLCTLLSIKTGGCSEDCGYCAQSARYSTGVQAERLMGTPEVLAAARRARENGSTRFCMGAAWRGVRAGDAKFNQVLDIVREVSHLGMEVCVTLGQLSGRGGRAAQGGGRDRVQSQSRYLARNITRRSSPPTPSRTASNTIRAVQGSGMALCCGGIVGLGESPEDRLQDARGADGLRPRAGKRAHQLPDGDARHAAGRTSRRSTSSSSCV